MVSGSATVTSDVSEILEFEALAGSYDRQGNLLGTARHIYHLDESTAEHAHEGAPEQTQAFNIPVPSELSRAWLSRPPLGYPSW